MGIFSRISDIISANFNELTEQFEDPEKMLKQAIREMDVSIAEATQQTAKAMANEKTLTRELERNRQQADQWQSRAETAVAAGDDGLARKALSRKREHESLVTALEDQIESARRAKLRTLICCVTRNVLSNRNRVQANRDQLLREWAAGLDDPAQARDDPSDAFYAAWVEDVLRQAVESMVAEYYRINKGDYVRVFYGRLCQQLPVVQLAEALQIQPDDVVNYFRHARHQLSERLQQVIDRQVHRYCRPEDWEAESAAEWQQLVAHLSATGGLEEAVRRANEAINPVESGGRPRPRLTRALQRLTSTTRRAQDTT